MTAGQEDTARTSLRALAACLLDIRDRPGVPPEDALCDPGLWPAMEALKATLNVLDSFPQIFGESGGLGLTRPLHDLLIALHDLAGGQVSPLLRTTEKQKRGSSTHYQVVTAWAAIAMDAFLLAGSTRMEAARKVAAELRGVDVSKGDHRNAVSWRTVAGWRDELNAGRGAPWARMAWDHYVGQRAGANRAASADFAMQMLCKYVHENGFRISP